MSFLQVKDIRKQLPGTFLLGDISFIQEALQKIAIAGETGSGKTSLLKIIAGLVQPDTGKIIFKGHRVTGPDEQLVPGHPEIAYLSQHYELRNNYRVEELLGYANKLPGSEAQILYDVCRISHLVKRRTDQLSGGEKQRIALARLLVGSPKLLLLDEPFSNLDPIHKKILKSVIKEISEKLAITCLLTSHDPLDTLSWADEIMVIKDGLIIQKGTPMQVYHQPANEYAAGLFGNYYLLDGEFFEKLTGLPAQELKGKQLFVRPEYFSIVPEQKDTLRGIVIDVLFWGGYYEVELLLEGKKNISIKTIFEPPFKNEVIQIKFLRKTVYSL
jgi:iron(III) transport system ATP-binding protein